jgi:hypothetical protein
MINYTDIEFDAGRDRSADIQRAIDLATVARSIDLRPWKISFPINTSQSTMYVGLTP